MHAQSFVWSIREIEGCLDDLHAQPRLAGRQVTLARSHRAREVLAHVTQLLSSANLTQPSAPWARHDDAIKTLLRAMHEAGTGTTAALHSRLDEPVIERLRKTGQIRTHGGSIVVPLDAVNGTANWPPLLGLLLDWATDLRDRTAQIIEKLRADNVTQAAEELWVVQSLFNRIDVFHDEIRRIRGMLQLLNSTVTIDQRLHDIVTEVLPAMFDDTTKVKREAAQ